MYRSTAAIGTSIKRLRLFAEASENSEITMAIASLEIAFEILSDRWRIQNSIHWNSSNAKTKFSIRQKIQGFAFDANLALCNGGAILNEFVDHVGIEYDRQENWCEVIKNLNFARTWLDRDFPEEVNCKQLSLPIYLP